MFWKFDLHSSSHIDTLLEREDVTLKELMDEEDVLQESKAQNRKLIEFLLKAECLEDLVSFIIEEPPQDMDEKIRYKYPNISCELLTSDVSQMNDRLGEDESLLMKLYSFLLNESPLNPLLEPPKKSVMKTTWGILDPPVGNTRLNVIRLISSLLQTNTSSINGDLMELNSIGVILDMFFKYTWNNFLHTQVEICIALILASPFENAENGTITDQDSTGDNLLLKHLFQKCQLIERILEAWDTNEKKHPPRGTQILVTSQQKEGKSPFCVAHSHWNMVELVAVASPLKKADTFLTPPRSHQL